MEEKYKQLIKACREGNLYDYISSEGYKYSKYELQEILKQTIYSIYQRLGDQSKEVESSVVDNLRDYSFFGEEVQVTINNEEQASFAIQERQNDNVWYVLKYDLETTAYNNELVFKTFKEAMKEFSEATPSYENEQVELVFAPREDDKEFGDNILIMYQRLG